MDFSTTFGLMNTLLPFSILIRVSSSSLFRLILKLLKVIFSTSWYLSNSYFIQLVASADCAGALDVTDDLQHLLVCEFVFNSILSLFYILTISL